VNGWSLFVISWSVTFCNSGIQVPSLQKKATFVGHMSEDGIECDSDKTPAIITWPQPTDVSKVRAFCGIASYYCSFGPNFAHIAQPLHWLTQKNTLFV